MKLYEKCLEPDIISLGKVIQQLYQSIVELNRAELLLQVFELQTLWQNDYKQFCISKGLQHSSQAFAQFIIHRLLSQK